jgi:hypothetical protein
MKPIKYCLNKQLTDICHQSIQLEVLSLKVNQLLPDELAAHCEVGSFSKGCLSLTAPNAAWATQLRYAIPELRDQLRKISGLYQLSSITVTVAEQRTQVRPKKVNPSKRELSDEAKKTILQESQNCVYQPLKKALLSLAEGENSRL